MIHRQKVLLHILKSSGGTVGRMQLVKWAFLLSQTASAGGKSFFQFLPYQYGPYSFCLTQEMEALVRNGYVEDSAAGKPWKLSEYGLSEEYVVDRNVKADVWRILRDHGEQSTDELLEHVYNKHPWFSVNSKRKRLKKRPIAKPAVFTAGYEGLAVDGFLDLLMRNGIQRLIDVRRNPVARRFGYHKSTLRRLALNVGIDYMHFPEVGIASENRQNLETFDDRLKLFDKYEKTTLRHETNAVRQIAALMEEKPSALVCLEAEACCCHRSRLAEPIEKMTGMEVIHLYSS